MRFRWFFLGYLLMFSIPVGEINLLPVLGYSLMLYAAVRLAKYEKPFSYAVKLLFAAIPIGAALLGVQIYLTVVGENALGAVNTVNSVLGWADELTEMAVMFFCYLGIRRMGERAELPALVKHSTRNMSVMLVYLLTEVTLSLLYTVNPSLFEGFGIIMLYPFVMGFIWRVLNLWMIFTCFLGLADSKEEREEKEKQKAREKQRMK